jgi:predicted dehydrogenase
MRRLNVAIIGHNFMGRAHSNAWRNVGQFFPLAAQPVLKLAVGRNPASLRDFADTWGWEERSHDWRSAVERDDIDIVDIAVPPDLHAEIALAAAAAGKHIFCEKPLALTSAEARAMWQGAARAGVVHYLNHNYRRTPAVMLARQLIDEGAVGRIFHWRGAYLQDWIVDPDFPLTWHLQRERAGAGPHFDLGSHNVDLARFLVGEVARVGAMSARFIEERPLPGAGAATFRAGAGGGDARGPVTVEDAAFVTLAFENGALGSIDTSRFAPGRKNHQTFEIYGSEGSLLFDLERSNELQFFSRRDPVHAQGFRTILATEGVHPFMQAWWPPGHLIGYQHPFFHAVVDFLRAIAEGGEVRPNFEDGLRETLILEAALEAARSGRHVDVAAP